MVETAVDARPAAGRPAPRPALTPLDFALYAAVVLAWSFSWLAMRWQVGVVAPEVSVVWRFLIAAPIMMAFAVLRGERLRRRAADHLLFAAFGATMCSTNFTLFYYAAKHIPSGLSAVIFSLASVINVVLALAFFGVRPERRVAAGALLGVIGISCLFYPEIAATRLDGGVALGLALGVGGTLSFCLGNMVSARMQRRGIPVLAATGWGMFYGAGLLALLAAARGLTFEIEPTAIYLGALVYLALFASVVAFACYLTLLGRIGADRAAYATVLMPVMALLISTFAEGYRWSLPALAGLVAVLAGNLLVLRTPRG
jgi:drug/metabolite transporter (DMT)-like permease